MTDKCRRFVAFVPGVPARSTLEECKMSLKKQTGLEEKIEAMKADGKDKHDVRQQEEVLAEAATMVSDTHNRLERAVVDLQKLLESKDCRYLGDSKEVDTAWMVLKDAQATVRYYHFTVRGGWICYTP